MTAKLPNPWSFGGARHFRFMEHCWLLKIRCQVKRVGWRSLDIQNTRTSKVVIFRWSLLPPHHRSFGQGDAHGQLSHAVAATPQISHFATTLTFLPANLKFKRIRDCFSLPVVYTLKEGVAKIVVSTIASGRTLQREGLRNRYTLTPEPKCNSPDLLVWRCQGNPNHLSFLFLIRLASPSKKERQRHPWFIFLVQLERVCKGISQQTPVVLLVSQAVSSKGPYNGTSPVSLPASGFRATTPPPPPCFHAFVLAY